VMFSAMFSLLFSVMFSLMFSLMFSVTSEGKCWGIPIPQGPWGIGRGARRRSIPQGPWGIGRPNPQPQIPRVFSVFRYLFNRF